MGRFSTGIKILNRRLVKLESRRATADLPRALWEFHVKGKIPDSEALRLKIELIVEAVEAMKNTMPQRTIKGETNER